MSEELLYPNVLRAVREQPWAIVPEKLASILDVLRFRSAGGRLTHDEIAARIGGRKEPEIGAFDIEAQQYAASGNVSTRGGIVAILPVYGVISQRADMMSESSGGTSVERLTARFRSALADNSVKAIVFDVDSPGGAISGVPELADEIRAARGMKPIAAVANTLAASAGYWIASQADPGDLVASPSSEIGSIGVVAAHEDMSAALVAQGVKVTLVSAGKYKTEGNPFEPLSEEARAYLQARVDEGMAMFERAVAKGRGVSVETIRSDFGQGRVVGAREAVSRKMADRVDTLDATVRRLGARPASSGGAAAQRQAAVSRARVV